MSERHIKELLNDLAIVESLLNAPYDSCKTDTERTMLKMERLRFKAFVLADLKLYSDEEIKAATKPRLKKRVVIFEEVEKVEFVEERGALWFFLMAYLMSDETIENRAFLMIAVELFGKDLVKKKTTELETRTIWE